MGKLTRSIRRKTILALIGALVASYATPLMSSSAPAAHRSAVSESVFRANPQIRLSTRPPGPSPVRGAGASARATALAASVGGTWGPLGPQPIQSVGSYGDLSGRVTSLAADPTNSTIVYAGTAGGGVWKTSNGGTTWLPLTDSQATLSIGAVAIDPHSPQTVYAATGEGNRCGDCGLSQGVLKSTDGGATWSLSGQGVLDVALTNASSLVVDRATPSRILLGTTTGLYVSTDAGGTWVLNATPAGPNATTSPQVDAIVQDPDVATRFWAGVGEACSGSGYIAVSNDSGAHWSINKRMSDFGFPQIERIGLDVAPGGILYGAAAQCADAQGNREGRLAGIIKSVDAGAHWTQVTAASLGDYFVPRGGSTTAPGQGSYDNVVAIDRSNPAQVVFGGINMLVTKDGGATFTGIGGTIYPDAHAIAFVGPNTFYTGNDGGVWKTSDLGGTGGPVSWTNLNASLAITNFYSGTALDRSRMIGGAQGGGTAGLVPGGPTPPAWKPLLNGGGTWTAMDPTPGSTVIYGEHPFGFIYKGNTTNTVTDPGQPNPSWTLAGPCAIPSDPACPEPRDFSAPFVMDATTPSRLYAATNRVYRTTSAGLPAGAGGWNPISGDLTTGTLVYPPGDWITAMALDAPDTIVTGSYFGRIMITTNASAASPSWTDISSGAGGPSGFDINRYIGEPWITSVAVYRGEVWVSLGILGAGRIWERVYVPSLQFPWMDLTGNGATTLPNHIVTAIARDPTSWAYTSTLYVGTDAGAYICPYCGYGNVIPSWTPLGSQMPNARIDAINLTADNSDIIAWTHGRGAWSIRHQAVIKTSTTSLTFPDQVVSERSPGLPLTITGAGTTSSTNLIFSVTGPNAADFFAAGCESIPLVPGISCTTSVYFRPSMGGPETATLTVKDDKGISSPPIDLHGSGILATASMPTAVTFPDAGVGGYSARNITITNAGAVNLDISNVSITGANAADFDAPSAYNCFAVVIGPILPGHSCTILVFFRPSDGGTRAATLNVVDNASGSPQAISLSGKGLLPNVALSPSTLDFGAVDVAVQGSLPLTITNNGPNTFAGLPVLGGANPGDFTAYPDPARPCDALPVGATCGYTIVFRPSALGPRSATLSIAHNQATANTTVTVKGIGAAEEGTLTPSPADFGMQPVGSTSRPLIVTLTNTGQVNDQIQGVWVDGANRAEFQQSDCLGQTIAFGTRFVPPGGSCTISVTFTPAGRDRRRATLRIDHAGYLTPAWSAALVGEGSAGGSATRHDSTIARPESSPPPPVSGSGPTHQRPADASIPTAHGAPIEGPDAGSAVTDVDGLMRRLLARAFLELVRLLTH